MILGHAPRTTGQWQRCVHIGRKTTFSINDPHVELFVTKKDGMMHRLSNGWQNENMRRMSWITFGFGSKTNNIFWSRLNIKITVLVRKQCTSNLITKGGGLVAGCCDWGESGQSIWKSLIRRVQVKILLIFEQYQITLSDAGNKTLELSILDGRKRLTHYVGSK